MRTGSIRQPFAARLTCSVRDGCEATGFSPQTIYRWIASGRLESRKVGRKRLIVVPSLLKILKLEPADTS
jgi:excisionase family DNA binding protein